MSKGEILRYHFGSQNRIGILANKYKSMGKKLHLVHLSPDCLEVLDSAKSMVELNLLEDPKYHIADDKLS